MTLQPRALLMALAILLSSCAPEPPVEVPETALEIFFHLPDLQGETGASARANPQGEQATLTLTMRPLDGGSPCVVADTFPWDLTSARLPISECIGHFAVSAQLTTPTRSFGTCDLLGLAECETVEVKLVPGEVFHMVLTLYEVELVHSGVPLEGYVALRVALTPEHRAFVESIAPEDRSLGAVLGGCVVGGDLSIAPTYDPGLGIIEWRGEVDAFAALMTPGEGCIFALEVLERGAARLEGEVAFTAPGGDVTELDIGVMDLIVVDAQAGVEISLGEDQAVDLRVDISQVAAWLDSGDWAGGLGYRAELSQGGGLIADAELSREGAILRGYLPVEMGFYTLRIFIEAEGAVLLSGQSPLDLGPGGGHLTIPFIYELSATAESTNWTRVIFQAAREGDPDPGGILVQIFDAEGLVTACETFEAGVAYTCERELRTGARYQATFLVLGALDYGTELRAFTTESVETLFLDPVILPELTP